MDKFKKISFQNLETYRARRLHTNFESHLQRIVVQGFSVASETENAVFIILAVNLITFSRFGSRCFSAQAWVFQC